MDLRRNITAMMFYLVCLYCTIVSADTVTTEEVTLDVTLLCNNGTQVCEESQPACHEVCGCDRIYKFDEEKKTCVINYQYLRELTGSKTYVSTDDDMVEEDTLSTKLQARVDQIFGGIIISVILFIVCAAICIISVCVYCYHIRKSDKKMKNEINALAQKFKINPRNKYSASLMKQRPIEPIEESCNVVVPSTDIMCV